ncbi:MAG: hypothetical protein KKA31_06230 [Candidatus Margulisbacteria bacterium]|nr:hypothetical protein [Candidatus Margulisiibacteriota bacterium]
MENKVLILLFSLLLFSLNSCVENNLLSFTADEQTRITMVVDNFRLAYNIPAVIVGVRQEGKEPLYLHKHRQSVLTGMRLRAARSTVILLN